MYQMGFAHKFILDTELRSWQPLLPQQIVLASDFMGKARVRRTFYTGKLVACNGAAVVNLGGSVYLSYCHSALGAR